MANDILTGLKTASQQPLDAKLYSLSESALEDLGANSNLAYTYYKGMRVYCAEEQSTWEWREVQEEEDEDPLLDIGFIYPSNLTVNGVNYSNKEYNFFPVSSKQLFYDITGSTSETGVSLVEGYSEDENTKVYILKNLISSDESVEIMDTGSTIDFKVTGSGENISLEDGITTKLNGTGTSLDPYKVEVVNLQAQLNIFPATLSTFDDQRTIFVNNGVTSVVITIPDSTTLPDNFSCLLIQTGGTPGGTVEVTIQTDPSNVLLYNEAFQNKIKGQFLWAVIERELGTNRFYLTGSLKEV